MKQIAQLERQIETSESAWKPRTADDPEPPFGFAAADGTSRTADGNLGQWTGSHQTTDGDLRQ